MFLRRVGVKRSLMLWGCDRYMGTVDLIDIKGNMHSEYYIDVLKNCLLENADVVLGQNWIFLAGYRSSA